VTPDLGEPLMARIGCWIALLATLLASACAAKPAPVGTRESCQETGGVWLSDGTCLY
jgi:hypothetical protein